MNKTSRVYYLYISVFLSYMIVILDLYQINTVLAEQNIIENNSVKNNTILEKSNGIIASIEEENTHNDDNSGVDNDKMLSNKDLIDSFIYANIEHLDHNIDTTKYAEIIIVNKITTRLEILKLHLGRSQFVGDLSITLHRCTKIIDPYQPNDYVLISVISNKIDDDPKLIFLGWLISNSPSISTIEHPIYEVTARACLDK